MQDAFAVEKSYRLLSLFCNNPAWVIQEKKRLGDAYYEPLYVVCYCAFEPRYGDHEYGYMAICKLCLKLGLPYILFRCIIAFLLVFLIVRAVNRFADRKNLVLSLYLIFPFLGSASGLRQACANSLVLYGMYFLLQNGRKNTYKYIVCVVLAALFHYSSLFFLLCVYAKYSKSTNIALALKCTLIGICIIIIAKTNIIYTTVASFTNREKTLKWLVLQFNYSGLYILALFMFVALLFVLYQAKIIMKNRGNVFFYSSKMNYRQVETVSRCIIISLLAFAGAMINSVVFLRLVLTLIPIAYAICADTFVAYECDGSEKTTNLLLYKYGMIAFCVLCALFVYGFWIGGETLKAPIGNLVFGV